MAGHNAAPTPTGFAEMIHDDSSIPQSHRPLHQQRIGYAKFFSRSHKAVVRVYHETGNVIETHEHTRDFKE
ncbi:MAG: hypothetical protein E6L06_01085 [Verrucomicrobia bacterium]|nr:MAG: hypothetical protein E6L06_01085 [Verrucomicrobiota bacterium]